jgi:uncharacterized protein
LISLLSSFFIAVAAAEVPVPPLAARVTDQTATLDAGQRSALEAKLAAFEQKKGSQVAVLIVPSTSPETIEQYSIRVVDQWKLGRKRVDDGVLLLVAKDDRRLRIEVGRGLEGAIPDAIAKRIIAEVITPRFKQGDFHGGIAAGVDRILGAIEGEPLPAPASQPRPSGAQVDWLTILFFALFIVPIAGAILGAVFGRMGGAALTGAAFGGLVWLFSQLLFAGIVAGIAAFVLSLFTRAGAGGPWSSGSGGYSGGGWSSGGSSSNGGGFSGGGGGFSGGGSSGSW